MANQMPAKPELREVVFKETESFSSAFVNGVYGGMSPAGIIAVSFFKDKAVLPDKIYVEIKDNKAVRETKRVGGNYIRRDVVFEAIFDVNTAKTIAEWLLNHVAEHEKQNSNESGSSNS